MALQDIFGDDKKQDETEWGWRAAEGPRPGLEPEDKASAHGMSSLPTLPSVTHFENNRCK